MYLKKLIILKNNGEEVRNLSFKKGLNLIVGKSNEFGSSNSVGKTSVIRCLNFCFGGKVDEFYLDPENKKVENIDVKNFLIKNQVKFELILGRSLTEDSVFDTRISRQVVLNLEKEKIDIINIINNNEYSIDNFQEKLKLVIFNTDVAKPSFRNLIIKFVRHLDIEVNNILKYLNPYTSDIDYTTLRFFLFGFSNPESIEKKQALEKELAKINKNQKALKAIIPNGLQQKIDLLQEELLEKEALRDSFKIEEEYKVDENELAEVEIKITKLNLILANLNADKSTLINRLSHIRSNEFKDNPQNIKYLYEEAKLLNINIQIKFEETINFHNSMLKNEESYLQQRIDKINETISVYYQQWSDNTKAYNSVLGKLSKQGALAEYTKLNEKINQITSTLSSDKSLLTQLESLISTKDGIQDELISISEKINKEIELFQKNNIHIFNTYFAKYSEILHKEKWYVSFDSEETNYKFDVKAFESNAGSGKKQALVAAFDIAYMAFIQDKKIKLPYPRFATQDKIEIIDIDELKQLSDLVFSVNGQLIAPIIQDKFKNFNMDEFSDRVILTLSPSDMFFKI